MSYQLNFVAIFPMAGLTLNAKLYNSAGAQVGATVTSGFIDHGDRSYSYWATIPNGLVGSLVVYDSANPTTRAVRFSINPQEGENLDAQLSDLPGAVWTYAWRTLTGNPAQPSAAAPVFTLASAVAGATRPIQVITWMRDGTTPEPLTGATLTGRIRNEQTLQTRDIVGALEITDAAGGIFAWHYDAQDVAQPGVFSVQFTAIFATAPVTARTVIGSWTVYESLS